MPSLSESTGSRGKLGFSLWQRVESDNESDELAQLSASRFPLCQSTRERKRQRGTRLRDEGRFSKIDLRNDESRGTQILRTLKIVVCARGMAARRKFPRYVIRDLFLLSSRLIDRAPISLDEERSLRQASLPLRSLAGMIIAVTSMLRIDSRARVD